MTYRFKIETTDQSIKFIRAHAYKEACEKFAEKYPELEILKIDGRRPIQKIITEYRPWFMGSYIATYAIMHGTVYWYR